MTKGWWGSQCMRIGAVVKEFFRYSKDLQQSSEKTHGVPLVVRQVRGTAISESIIQRLMPNSYVIAQSLNSNRLHMIGSCSCDQLHLVLLWYPTPSCVLHSSPALHHHLPLLCCCCWCPLLLLVLSTTLGYRIRIYGSRKPYGRKASR